MTDTITIPRDNLLQALNTVLPAVGKRGIIDDLCNVLLTISGQQGIAVGSNLNVEIETGFVMDDETKAFNISVNAKKLQEIVKLSSDESLHFTLNENQTLTILSGNTRFTVKTLPVKDFPRIETSKPLDSFSIPEQQLAAHFTTVDACIAANDDRPGFNGALMETSSGALLAVSTDGHRLALSKQDESSVTSNRQVIIPRESVIMLGRMLSLDSTDVVEVGLFHNHIRIRKAGITVTSKLLGAKFPNYKGVLPKSTSLTVTVDRSQVTAVVKRAIVASGRDSQIKLSISDNMVVVESNHEDSAFSEELSVETKGTDLEIGFQSNFLLDAFDSCSGPTLRLDFTGQDTPLRITDPENNNIQFIVMPVRL